MTEELIKTIVVATITMPLTIRQIAESTGGDPHTGMAVDWLVDHDRLSEKWMPELNDYVYWVALELPPHMFERAAPAALV
jgi:hypothetical protein